MESTAFNWYQLHQAAWNPLHSMEINCTTLIRIHCIQYRCMESTAFNRDPLGHTAWNPLHSLGSISQCCIESTELNLDAWNPLLNWYQLHNSVGNPLHSFGIHCRMLHGFHSMQPGYIAPRCMQSTAFTRDAFHNAAWNPVHSIMPHDIQCIQSGSIGPCCMEATAFNRDTMHHSA